MQATPGSIYWEEDYAVIDNLIHFVNSCECMLKPKSKKICTKKE